MRILKHAGALDSVLENARQFTCDICKVSDRVKLASPAAPPLNLLPLVSISMDVKFLPGWLPDQRIRGLNIVCETSSLQQVLPFQGNEDGKTLRSLYHGGWTKYYGCPRFAKIDAGSANLSEEFLMGLERDGTTPLDTPADQHEQLGKAEVRGQHFERRLARVLEQAQPASWEEWLECVDLTVEAHNMFFNVHCASPNQIVLGRNPEIPGDLLKENPDIISNSAILHDKPAMRTNAVRMYAQRNA